MPSLYWLVVLAWLGCLCDGQAFQKGPFFQLSSQESLLQPVQQAAQGQSSLLASEVPQRYPSLEVPQGLSSQQLDPLVQNSNHVSPVEPVFEVPYSQPSVQVESVRPVLPAHYGQASGQVSTVLPVHQVQSSAPVSLVQPAAQVPPSVKYQWLAVPSGVTVECREDSVLVEVQQDLLSTGQIIQPSEITLGGCAPIGQDPSKGVLLFASELHGCGSTLTMTDSLIYTFTLVYVPKGLDSTPIVRSHGAVINIECHYLRRINVSSNAVMPTWVPYSAAMSAEERLVFSLQLMTDNWQLERASNMYFLGDILNIEASVVVANHQPLRVFVDSCVATLEPDVTSVPRYAFVGNYGGNDSFCILKGSRKTTKRQEVVRNSNTNGSCVCVRLEQGNNLFQCGDVSMNNAYPDATFTLQGVRPSLDGNNLALRCLTDAKVTGSRSQFLPRKQNNKLQMQLDAFRFSQETRNSVYITCILKATMVSKRPDPQHKACSYSVSANRWRSADGDDQVCGCCDTTCNLKGRSVADFKGKAVAGPVVIQDQY